MNFQLIFVFTLFVIQISFNYRLDYGLRDYYSDYNYPDYGLRYQRTLRLNRRRYPMRRRTSNEDYPRLQNFRTEFITGSTRKKKRRTRRPKEVPELETTTIYNMYEESNTYYSPEEYVSQYQNEYDFSTDIKESEVSKEAKDPGALENAGDAVVLGGKYWSIPGFRSVKRTKTHSLLSDGKQTILVRNKDLGYY